MGLLVVWSLTLLNAPAWGQTPTATITPTGPVSLAEAGTAQAFTVTVANIPQDITGGVGVIEFKMSTVAPGEFANEFKLYTSNPDTDTAAQPVTLLSAINADYPEIYYIQWNTTTFAQIPASGTFNYWIQVPDDGSFFDAMGAIEARFLVRRRGTLAGVIPNLVASNTLTFEVVDAPLPAPDAVPTAPATLTATAGDGQVELSWAAPDLTSGNSNRLNDAQITTYQYRQRPDGGAWTSWTDIPNSGFGQAHGTHYRVTGLTNDAPYTFELRAVNDYGGMGQGTGPASTVTSTPGARPLAPPTGLRATAGNGYVVLEWAHPQNPAISGYDWQVREAGEPFGAWTRVPVDPHLTRVWVRDLTNDVTYTYRLRVRDVDGRISLPTAVTVTPRAAPPLPIALTVSLASRQVGQRLRDVITLQWDRPDDIDSLTHYDYQYRTGRAVYGPWTQIRGRDSAHCTGSTGGICSDPPYVSRTSGTITHHLASLPGDGVDLEPGVTYTFRLRAHNEAGTTLSAPATITFVPTGEIVGRAPPKLTITGVRYSWVPSRSGVTAADRRPNFTFARPATSEYGVLTYEYSIDGGRTWYADLADDPTYVEGADYAHQVRAVSPMGPGPASDPVQARYLSRAEGPASIDATRVAYDATTRRLTLHWPASTNPYVVERHYGSERVVLAPDVTRYTLPQPVAVGEEVDITLRECVGLPRSADRQQNCLAAFRRSTFYTVGTPHQPQGLRGTPGNGVVRLTWLDPEDPGITDYEYQVQTSRSTPLSSAWRSISGEATTTDYVVRNLTNYQVHRLWLRAVNAQGPSASTRAVVVTPQPAGIPAPPANLQSTVVNDGRVAVWADPGDRSLTHYEYRHLQGTTCRSSLPWETTWRRLSLPPSRQGYHRVYLTPAGCGFQLRAVNAQGPSLPKIPTPFPVHVATPTGFAITPGPAQLTLTWDEPWRELVEGYRYTLDGGTTWVDIPDSGPTATGTLSRYTLTGLTNGQAYPVSLQAVNFRGSSAPTAAVTATPRAVAPRAPTGVRVTSAWTEDAAQLTWADPGDPSLTDYQVQQNGGPWTTIPNSDATTVTHTVTGLTPGTTYRFAVRARNAQGASPASAPVTLVAGEAGETTGFTVTPGNGQVTLRWTDPSGPGVTGYAYQQDGGPWTAITGAPPYVLTGLTNNRVYTVALRSRTPHGPGPATAPVTVTPVHPDAPPRIRVVSVEPTNRSAFLLPLGSLHLWWEAGDTLDQPIDFYQYRQSEDAGRTWGAWTPMPDSTPGIFSLTVRTLSYVISGLRDNQAYTYQVRGVNDHDGNGQPDYGPASLAVTGTTRVCAGATCAPSPGTTPGGTGGTGDGTGSGSGRDPADPTDPANAAPVVTQPLPAQTLPAGTTSAPLALGTYFRDPDGDPLTYTAVAQTPTVVTATLTGAQLTLTGITPGTTTVTVTAQDPAGATGQQAVTVTVTQADTARIQARLRRVTREVLSKQALALSDRTTQAIGTRLATLGQAEPEAARYRLGGATSLAEAVRGHLPLTNTTPPPPPATPSGGPRADTTRPLAVNLRDTLGQSAFVLPLRAAAEAAGVTGLTLWGEGGYTRLTGDLTGGLDWQGDLFSLHVGADVHLNPTLLGGVALSYSDGRTSYTESTTGPAVTGDADTWLMQLTPYLGWQAPDRARGLWGTMGYGWGQLEVRDAALDDDPDAATQTSTLSLRHAALGGHWGLLQQTGTDGTTTLKAKSEAALVQVALTEEDTYLDDDTINAGRLRLVLEGRYEQALEAGAHWSPFVELGVRYDLGDGTSVGAGVEVGGGVHYAVPALGLTLEVRGRGLLGHGAYREYGASGLIRVDPRRDGQGLALSLTPTYGQAASGVQQLWTNPAVPGAAGPQAPPGQVTADVGYGLRLPGTLGLVTPYGGTTLGPLARYRLGSRWRHPSGLQLSLEGTRQAPTGRQPVNQGVRLQAEWRF